MDRVPGVVARVLPYVSGVAGQALNLAAMLVALALAPTSAVVNLVLSAAIATSALQFGLLALSAHLPLQHDPRLARESVLSSWAFLMLLAAALLATGVALTGLEVSVGPALGFSVVLLLGMALDSTVIALFVRDDDSAQVARNRLRYGVVNIVVTTVVAASSDWAWSLVVSGAAVYVLTAGWVLTTSRYGVSHLLALREVGRDVGRRRAVTSYVVANVAHGGSYLINGLTNQISAFALPALGARQAGAWAAMTSIAGGFGSVVFQLVVPTVDASLSRRVRTGQLAGRLRTCALGLAAGAGLALVATGAGAAGALVLGYLDGLAPGTGWGLVLALVLYWGSAITITPLTHVMSLLGMRRTRLAWDVVRATVLLAALLLGPGGLPTLELLGLVNTVFALAYVALVVAALRRHRVPPTPV